MRNPVETWACELFERPVATYDFRRQWVFAMAPEYVSEFLVGQQSKFPKSELDRRLLNRLVDDSVLITRGPRWRWQRQAVAGVFQPSALKPIVPIFIEAVRQRCHSWLDGRATSRVDVDLTRLAFDIIHISMLGARMKTIHSSLMSLNRMTSGFLVVVSPLAILSDSDSCIDQASLIASVTLVCLVERRMYFPPLTRILA
ncbi:MAG: cytochrome P450 [Hyphomicrobiaceae bacterium TMED74]|nr:hypothetical protein [Filomicrobium sp.]RPG48592.1 MAG: cytochrome P450 [Hyphomicrobiaceae bacterium TMED74]